MRKKSLFLQPDLVTEGQFLDTFLRQDGPKAISALNFLQSMKVTPLNYGTKNFLDINLLAAWFNWAGTISIVDHGRTYLGRIYTPEENVQELETLARKLRFTTNPEGLECMLTGNGVAYTRLVSNVVSHVAEGDGKRHDTKASAGFDVPDYIRYLVSNIPYFSQSDQKKALEIIKGHVDILFKRKYKLGISSGKIRLPLQRSRYMARKLATHVLQMINTTYPLIGLNEDSIRIYPHATPNRFGIEIYFSMALMADASRHYNLIPR